MTEPQARRTKPALAIMLLSLSMYTAADLASKEWALVHLSSERHNAAPPLCQPDEHGRSQYQRNPLPSRTWLDGVLRLSYAENCGAAFSMLRTAPAWLRALVFGVACIAACIGLSVAFIRGHGGRPFAAAVPLLLSGVLGNASDRLRHGFVVDFLQVDPQLFVYPVFNVADIALVCGAILLLLDGVLAPRAARQRHSASPLKH